MKKPKIGDVFLVLIIISLTVFIALFNFDKGDKVVIEADGKIIKTFDLNENVQYIYEDKYKNIITVSNGEACISDSNCPDKICVNSGRIKNSNEIICCLPNKLIVRIITIDKNVDVISG